MNKIQLQDLSQEVIDNLGGSVRSFEQNSQFTQDTNTLTITNENFVPGKDIFNLFINGVRQAKDVDYTYNGNVTITKLTVDGVSQWTTRDYYMIEILKNVIDAEQQAYDGTAFIDKSIPKSKLQDAAVTDLSKWNGVTRYNSLAAVSGTLTISSSITDIVTVMEVPSELIAVCDIMSALPYVKCTLMVRKVDATNADVMVLGLGSDYGRISTCTVSNGVATRWVSLFTDRIETPISKSLSYGVNYINKTGAVPTGLDAEFTPRHYVNLLGKAGNFETIGNWTSGSGTLALDTTNKLFGQNCLKFTAINAGAMYTNISNATTLLTHIQNKKILVSGYIKNGNGSFVQMGLQTDTSGTNTVGVYATTWTRVALKINSTTSTTFNLLGIVVQATTSGQYGYIDGLMINEITDTEYANDSVETLMARYPYVDSVGVTRNIMIQTGHGLYNQITNGDFNNSNYNWASESSTSSISSNILTNTADGLSTYGRITMVMSNYKPKTNDKIFVKARVKVTNSVCAYITILFRNGTGTPLQNIQIPNPIQNQTYDIYGIIQAEGEYTNGARIYLQHSYVNAATASGKVMEVDGNIGIFAIPITGTVYENMSASDINSKITSYFEGYQGGIEKCVIEGDFLEGDKIKLVNGQVTGSKMWRNKTLFGKDCAWDFDTDYTGFKRIKLYVDNNAIGTIAYGDDNIITTKYDGSILPDLDSSLFADRSYISMSTKLLRLSIADTDSGWSEAINPNISEVKAFMNGWVAFVNNGTRYTVFRNIMISDYGTNISAYPPGSATTLTVATSGTTSITVADASMFKAGDLLAVVGLTTPTAITGISGNVITLNVTIPVGVGIGGCVVRADITGTDERNIIHCINNVAPKYSGYQLYYKLATPMPIGEDSDSYKAPIIGETPMLKQGDNFITIDSGNIVDETITKTYNDGNHVYIAVENTGSVAYSPSMYLKQPTTLKIYKNGIDDTLNWEVFADGNGVFARIIVAKYDSLANYTIDYNIIDYQNPKICAVTSSYNEGLVESITDAYDMIETKQDRNEIIDRIVDLALYERVSYMWAIPSIYHTSGIMYLRMVIPISKKLTTPIVNVIDWRANVGGGASTYTDIKLNGICKIGVVTASATEVAIRFDITDATTITNIKTNGVQVGAIITADCRGVI